MYMAFFDGISSFFLWRIWICMEIYWVIRFLYWKQPSLVSRKNKLLCLSIVRQYFVKLPPISNSHLLYKALVSLLQIGGFIYIVDCRLRDRCDLYCQNHPWNYHPKVLVSVCISSIVVSCMNWQLKLHSELRQWPLSMFLLQTLFLG